MISLKHPGLFLVSFYAPGPLSFQRTKAPGSTIHTERHQYYWVKALWLARSFDFLKNWSFYLFLKFSGKEGIYLEDHVADNVVDDRFSFRSNDPNNYSPSFYHFRPSKTSVSRPGGSIRKESRSDSPFYKAGNSYTGKKMFLFKFLQQFW